jgi:hypothetical protein
MLITTEVKIFKKNIPIDEVSKHSHKKVKVKCDHCGKIKEIKYNSYNVSTNNGVCDYYCNSKDCINKKRTIVIQEKYGVNNVSQLQNVKDKKIETSLKNYGVEYPIQSNEIKEKIKNINNKNFGKDWITQTDNFKEKSKITNLERYGTENAAQSTIIKNKSKKTNIEKYEADFYLQSELFKDIVKKRKIDFLSNKYCLEIIDMQDDIFFSKCNKCDQIFESNYQMLLNRFISNTVLCTICNPIKSLSGHELQLQNFVKENFSGEIILTNRDIIKPYELDIYIPELKLAFEFNGLYWHSEQYRKNDYHFKKTEFCEKLGIQLIHVYEDDWIFKNDIIKSIILNKLNKTPNKIYARKCEIKEITDIKLIRNFLDKNHMQGYINSEIKIGLFYENELVSIMTFGKKRKIMNSISNNNEYEMYRFCNKLNINIIGGINRLFSYFIKKYDFSKIISYVDRSYFNGDNYIKLGFKLNGKTQPNYYYIINGKKEYRFKYRKDVLIKEGFDKNKTEHQIMLERGFFRIYNSGNFRMMFEKK